MTALFAKLNLKSQPEIVVLNAPESFEAELAELARVSSARVHRDSTDLGTVRFALAFAITQTQLDAVSKSLVATAEGDAVVWLAYPKGSSRKYRCEFNRDSEWRILTGAGFETVRQVAIDEDWSALRFRRTEYVRRPARTTSR